MRTRLVVVTTMVVLVALIALALSACGEGRSEGGGQENEKSASGGGAATNGQIAFRRYLDPDQTKAALFAMNPGGSHVRQIMHPPEGWRDDDPVWSPDGTKVAFYRQRIDESMSRIMVLNPETGDVHEVTHCGPNQGQPKQGPPGRCESDFYPNFSPDGDSISFRRILGPDEDCCRVEGIFIVGLDGSDPHQVTNVDPKLPEAYSDWGSAFSPDGKMLVFERVRTADESHAVFVQPIDSPQDARQITPWKMNCQDHPEFSPDGTGLHQLTHASADKQYGGSSFSPSFSEGEGWITGSRAPGYGDEGNADVFRLLINDGDVVRELNLTKSTIWDSNPNWGSHQPVG